MGYNCKDFFLRESGGWRWRSVGRVFVRRGIGIEMCILIEDRRGGNMEFLVY